MKSDRATAIVEAIKCDFCGYFAEDMWSVAVQQTAAELLAINAGRQHSSDVGRETREFIDDELCTV